MNSDINNVPRKSSRELKNEVLNDLKKLNQDVDQLKDHLTPGQIIDDAIYYRHERTPRATFDYLKQNPVGTSFLALGTLLLMEDGRSRSMEAIAREKASGYIDSARSSVEGVRSTVDGIRTKVGDMSASIKSKFPGSKETDAYDTGSEFGFVEGSEGSSFEDFKDQASQSFDAAKSRISSATDSVKDQFQDVKSGVEAKIPDIKNKAYQGLDAAKSKFGSAAEAVKGQIQEGYRSARNLEPLTYVVLGAGLGTLTGASLPLLEREKNFVDNNLDAKISDFTSELQAALNESANILKSEFFNDLSGFDFNLFGGKGSESRAV